MSNSIWKYGVSTVSDRRLLTLLAIAGMASLAACTESFEGGAACPSLCPEQTLPLREVVLDAISFDATVPGFPPRGSGTYLMLAASGNDLETRAVVRFDSLPGTYPTGTGPQPITMVGSAALQLVVDTAFSSVSGPATLEIYDVDAGGADTSDAAVSALFTPDRLIGTMEFAGDGPVRDTLDIALSDSAVAEQVLSGTGRLRLGLRLVSATHARLSVFSSNTGAFARLRFLPVPQDSAVFPVTVFPRSLTPDDRQIALDYTDYVIPMAGAFPLTAATGDENFGVLVDSLLAVGGVEGRRAFVRFEIPDSLFDAGSIVRATLILQQRPSPDFGFPDSLVVVSQVVVASARIPTARAALIVDTLGFFPIPSLRLVPGSSAERRIEVVNAIPAWRASRGDFELHAITLRAGLEGRTPSEILFYSTDAPPALRPKLRISYIPRLEFGLP
jgi:hypothetical protein